MHSTVAGKLLEHRQHVSGGPTALTRFADCRGRAHAHQRDAAGRQPGPGDRCSLPERCCTLLRCLNHAELGACWGLWALLQACALAGRIVLCSTVYRMPSCCRRRRCLQAAAPGRLPVRRRRPNARILCPRPAVTCARGAATCNICCPHFPAGAGCPGISDWGRRRER